MAQGIKGRSYGIDFPISKQTPVEIILLDFQD
jgi:hypothetical protein